MTIVRGGAGGNVWPGKIRRVGGWMPSMFARSVGPLLAAALWSAFGGYGAVLAVLAACTIIAAGFVFGCCRSRKMNR